MALFGSKKKTVATETAEKKAVAVQTSQHVSSQDYAHIIRKPRITEKATIKSESGVYVFEVAQTATKASIAKAIKELYNVLPVRVAVAAIPTKTTRSARTGKLGLKRGGKKAYVYLKKGETIEFV